MCTQGKARLLNRRQFTAPDLRKALVVQETNAAARDVVVEADDFRDSVTRMSQSCRRTDLASRSLAEACGAIVGSL